MEYKFQAKQFLNFIIMFRPHNGPLSTTLTSIMTLQSSWNNPIISLFQPNLLKCMLNLFLVQTFLELSEDT